MKINFFIKTLDYGIYALAILLAFLLIFEQYILLPDIIEWFGHLHPLVLHFPIVLIILTVIQYWRNDHYFSLWLGATTFLTLITAITGLLLSIEESTAKGELILSHQWAGASLAYLTTAWYWFFQNVNKNYARILHGVLISAVILTGHLGGMVTHGEDFLTPTWMHSKPTLAEEDCMEIFDCFVSPILNDKCVSCHNPNKSKGELILSDFAGLMKGGENGPVIDRDDYENSALLQVISLPSEHEHHMPPKDEEQLTDEEIAVINAWVRTDASDSLLLTDIEEESELYVLARAELDRRQSGRWEDLPEITDKEIASLTSDYCTIRRMYNQSNALQVLIYPGAKVAERLQKIKSVAQNVIELDLNNLPLSEQEMSTVGSFENLEFLNIGNSDLNSEQFAALGKLSKLKVLKAYETQLDDAVVSQVASFENLTNLYIYHTAITDSGVDKLISNNPTLQVYTIPPASLEFRSILPSPKIVPNKVFFKKAFFIRPEIPLENIDIFYTVDGTNPDEQAEKFTDSLNVTSTGKLKFFASKEGWDSSAPDSAIFIKSDFSPKEYALEHGPEKKYSGRGIDLLFDLEKGPTDYDDSAWMAFRNEALVLNCAFDGNVEIGSVVLSSIVQTDQYLFPPSSIMVYGGATAGQLSLVGELRPSVPKSRQPGHMEFYTVEIANSSLKFLQVVVNPLSEIPEWHNGKGERGWFFIDEIVFTEYPGLF